MADRLQEMTDREHNDDWVMMHETGLPYDEDKGWGLVFRTHPDHSLFCRVAGDRSPLSQVDVDHSMFGPVADDHSVDSNYIY